MFIDSIIIKNFRGYKYAELKNLRKINAFVGKNDSGKSTILEAIAVFLQTSYKVTIADFYLQQPDEMYIQLNFTEYPKLITVNETNHDLEKIGYIHSDDNLKVRRRFTEIGDRGQFLIITTDFENSEYQNLIGKKEKEINVLLDYLGLDYSKSGRGITNYSKVCQIRSNLLKSKHKIVDDVIIVPNNDISKELLNYFPVNLLHLKSRDEKDVEGTYIQNYFRETISIEESCKEELEKIQDEIKKNIEAIFSQIHIILNEHLPKQYAEIRPEIIIDLRKIFSVDVLIKDSLGIETPYLCRGTGTKRLLTLSVIQHIAASDVNLEKDKARNMLLLLEEPETYLHPEAQRALSKSIKIIAEDPDYQIFITSHSPSVIAEVPFDSLSLTHYSVEGCKIAQEVDYFQIAEELGIRPSDNLFSYDLCIFVEGKTDVEMINHIFRTFYRNKLDCKLLEKIGIIPTGGNNIYSLVSFNLLHKLNRKFMIIIDSDKNSLDDKLHRQKKEIKRYAETYGGYCHILRKREIENYIHPEATIRFIQKNPQIKSFEEIIRNINDFTDVKKLLSTVFGMKRNETSVISIPSLEEMTKKEFNEISKYLDSNSIEKFEFDEIVDWIIKTYK